MKKKDQQQEKVKSFFDRIAAHYNQKYERQNKFLHYYFQQRICEATAGQSFVGKNILDIGAGTCVMFYHLKSQGADFDYFALDISSEMLGKSGLSPDAYHVGNIDDFPFRDKKFDFIFLLGVTTYFDEEDLQKHVHFIHDHLCEKKGIAVISFTNRQSLDFRIRQLFRSLARKLRFEKNVLGQGFKIYAYSYPEIRKLIAPLFTYQKETFLNQTFPPFNRLFPRLSISLAYFLQKHITSKRLLSLFSSDFMIHIHSKKWS
ncbi:MAG: class I SAM-dependent methyltransferase [Bacteroidota bacterium]